MHILEHWMIKDFSDIKRYYARTSQTCGVNGDETLTGVMTLGIFLTLITDHSDLTMLPAYTELIIV